MVNSTLPRPRYLIKVVRGITMMTTSMTTIMVINRSQQMIGLFGQMLFGNSAEVFTNFDLLPQISVE